MALLLTADAAHADCPGEGDCCVPNDTPGCEWVECCELICADDPFCCMFEWDAICANAAQFYCNCHPPGPGCGDFESGDCCAPNGSPYCNNVECCELICAKDPFCCQTEWDLYCAGAANEDCAVCHSTCPGEGDCCVPNDTPGCKDAECCELICADDPFCCDVIWDEFCAFNAYKVCICGDPACVFHDEGDCCAANETPGCEDFECCEEICMFDKFCCFNQWDEMCAQAANEHCDVCTEPIPGDLNGDGVVDGEDLLILLSNWGNCAECDPDECIADLNNDCTVDGADLLILLSNWG